ncbi:MAG: hypothetical protein LBH07_06700 [Treponema sp.]|jgi:NAD(P)-dependent dehydrogenase (short-subunit alcohol dehydrogenase family)|nr:hypothetical protein [Treponema sp.]
MTRGILITGNETSLLAATAAEAAKRTESFATVLVPNRFSDLKSQDGESVMPKVELSDRAIPLSWNPASSISARTMVLAAENRLGQINDAILICSPPAAFKTPAPEEIEFFVNNQIKGWFFLIQDLLKYFRRTGKGSLSLVAPEISSGGKNTQVDLMGPPALASFQSFTQGILASSVNEPFLVMGFTGAEAGVEEEFAAWLFKVIDEGNKKNSGRWQKFSKIKFFR